ncbi:hypothetical protein D3C80_607140 [compost metagenome]
MIAAIGDMLDNPLEGETIECAANLIAAAAITRLEIDLLEPRAGRIYAGLNILQDQLGSIPLSIHFGNRLGTRHHHSRSPHTCPINNQKEMLRKCYSVNRIGTNFVNKRPIA